MTTLPDNRTGTSTYIQPRTAGVHLVGALVLSMGAGTSLVASPIPRAVREASMATDVGQPVAPLRHRPHPAADLRLRSGLTWEQMAQIFGVSRRAVHFWVSGGRMTVENERKLQEVLAAFRLVDTGRNSENRMMLATPLPDGSLPLDLLASGEYDRFIAGLGGPRPGLNPSPSRSGQVAPPALGPGVLINGLRGVAHKDTGVRRVAKSKRREIAS